MEVDGWSESESVRSEEAGGGGECMHSFQHLSFHHHTGRPKVSTATTSKISSIAYRRRWLKLRRFSHIFWAAYQIVMLIHSDYKSTNSRVLVRYKITNHLLLQARLSNSRFYRDSF